MNLNRRSFLKHASTGLGALALGAHATAQPKVSSKAAPPAGSVTAGLPKDWRKMRKLDAHNHVFTPVHKPNADWSEVENLVEAGEVLGIEKIFCSRPVTGGALAEIEVVREANDSVIAAMKRYPGRIAGYCFVQPGNGQAALDEIERCLDAGMMGVKLYNQYKYTDPKVAPIVERCIQRKIVFLGHSAFLTDPRTLAAQPNTSHALDFCALSQRYPELILLLGHINGGGDWEWAIKGLRECSNVYLDTSGSVLEDQTLELCVRHLGHRRIIFATDGTMEGCVGKVLSAELTAEQREDIFWRNFQRLLERRSA